MIAVIRMERARSKANDFALALALYTDRLIRRMYANEDLAIAVAEPTTLLAVRDAAFLAPDPASAVVTLDSVSDERSVEESRCVLIRFRAGWLIYEIACGNGDEGY